MGMLDQLKRDHRLLRSKLEMLEAAVSMAPHTWFVLREGCFEVSHLLQEHSEREANALAAGYAGVESKELAQLATAHQERLQSFRILSRCFVDGEQAHPIKELCDALTAAVDGLEEELYTQDDELFPVFERVMEDRPYDGEGGHATGQILSEEMTVKHVITQYPETKAVFDRLWVNLAYEGYDCLEAVAWRHGMQTEELLGCLAQALLVPPVHAEGFGNRCP